jgi:hypothetical protein
LRKFLIGVLVIVGLGYGFLKLNYPTCTFRYKLTAEVMTPDGLKTGSSVIEVSYRDFFSLSGVPNLMMSARGEAVFVPLDKKRLFVVTLTSTASGRGQRNDFSYNYPAELVKGPLDLYALPLKVLNVSWIKNDEWELDRQIAKRRNERNKIAAPFENLPTLVVFEDITNSDSVVVVQPNKLDEALGPGFALQNVWLELSDDLPTQSKMVVFPWWGMKVQEWEKKWIFSASDKLIDSLYYSAFKLPTIKGIAQ